ncbi:probable glycosyltransferase At5g25310 [Cynara cardunculus var. scolymus]|uniref:Exostosin-like protein n=1 Tax=Cynara cardunculus var. scolymus TaxID=59895 RepID=A0A118K5Z5_CYNCS|nr:probable glycosyltransferase At5g25310 [Cynara cardunculus var. scolymus]KVI09856.1 Exostosin-like protein [Cynara cardunculus var. scolymus]
MAAILLLLSLLTFTVHVLSDLPATTPRTSFYLSPNTLFSNYDKMLHSFKIFVYEPPSPFTGANVFTTTPESQFYTSLLRSPFVTDDPSQAHLFFIPFPSSLSTRNLARLVRNIRITFPFWNRTLGADHFYLSAAGVDSSSDRNVVELKKNSIQISCFPTSSGLFIPHKDITLPPIHPFQTMPSVNSTPAFLGYMKLSKQSPFSLIEEIKDDPQFKVEYAPGNRRGEFMKNSRFCLFMYGDDMTWMVEAMGAGCVPVVVTDRPIQDLPLMDVMKWSEIAVFVGSSGGAKALRGVLDGIEKSRYDEMMESGVVATQHLVWNTEPQTHDAFHMILYQLWLRRHTIRYARWAEQ